MEQIGMELPEKVIEVKRDAIIKFTGAIGDNNPKFNGHVPIAPPTFIVTMTIGQAGHYKWDFGRTGLHGGEEYEYIKPIKAGDTITCKTKIVDIYEKEGKRKMAFMVLESDLINSDSELVARARRTRIRME